jgi:hypothetical protein
MPKRLSVLCVFLLVLSTSAFAQNINDILRMFGGVIQQGMIQSARSEWRTLPPTELSCLDQALRQQGASVDVLASRGILPSDARLALFRSGCRSQGGQQHTVQPSFSCAKARTPDELAICSNPELSELDNAVAAGYEYVRRANGDPFARQANVPLFQARQACGADLACIRERQMDAIRTYHDLGAPINVSMWNHNGSAMDLVANGRSRKFFYETPRAEMLRAGARPGSLSFAGESIDQQYVGTAFIFNPNCGQIPYQVSGPILDEYEKVVLQGQVPRMDAGCHVLGSLTDTLEFTLLKPQGTASAPPPPPTTTESPIVAQPPLVESPTSSASIAIPMHIDGGTYVVPVLINDAITLEFVVDSGAADVSIPADVVMTLMRTGTLRKSDFLGQKTYVLADGSKVPSETFLIRSLKVGNKVLENVNASVAPVQGELLLGQSFLSRLKSWSVDNTKHALIFE